MGKRHASEEAKLDDSTASLRSNLEANENPTNKDIVSLLIKLLDKQDTMTLAVNRAFQRLEVVENKCEQLTNRTKAVEETGETHTNAIGNLESASELHQKSIDSLRDLSQANESMLHKLEQSKIDSDLFLSGFPIKPDHKKVVTEIIKIYDIAPESIERSYQYEYEVRNKPSANSTQKNETRKSYHHVVISFKNMSTKMDFLMKKKNLGPLYYQQLDPSVKDPKLQSTNIRCTNRLTKFNLKAQSRLFNAKNEGKIYGFQLHNGVFRAKKEERNGWTVIDTESSLDLLVQ